MDHQDQHRRMALLVRLECLEDPQDLQDPQLHHQDLLVQDRHHLSHQQENGYHPHHLRQVRQAAQAGELGFGS